MEKYQIKEKKMFCLLFCQANLQKKHILSLFTCSVSVVKNLNISLENPLKESSTRFWYWDLSSHTQTDYCELPELYGVEVVSCDAQVPLFPVLAVILSHLIFSLIPSLTGWQIQVWGQLPTKLSERGVQAQTLGGKQQEPKYSRCICLNNVYTRWWSKDLI